MSDDIEVLDLTFIEDEQRRWEVGNNMSIVWDSLANGGVHLRWDHLCEVIRDTEWDEETQTMVVLDRLLQKHVATWLTAGHVVLSEEPLTIEGSLLCGSCKQHGHVTNGIWIPC